MSSSSTSSNNCNSRHLSWLMKSCFPDTDTPPHHFSPTTTTISSLPDDVILEILSFIPQSSLPSASTVCRRWSELLDSPEFHHLRRRRGLLQRAVFVISFTDSGLFSASLKLGLDNNWITRLFRSNYNDVISANALRLAAIGRWVYIIGKTTLLRCDTWTGAVVSKQKMSLPRKKFAAAVIDGKIYVAGGSTRSTAVEEYDPVRNSWRVVAHAPRMRYGCIGAAVDGVLYVIGGLKVGDASRAAHVYASSMDLYDVAARRWLRSRTVPGGGCVVAACSAGENVNVQSKVYLLASHAVELSFWSFNGNRRVGGAGFGEWCRLKSPPLPSRIRLDGTVRFGCVGVGEKVVLIQVMGCIDDLLRRSGRSTRGVKEALVLVYDSGCRRVESSGGSAGWCLTRRRCLCGVVSSRCCGCVILKFVRNL